MATEESAGQTPEDGVQESAVSAMVLEEVPRRRVTVMLPLWWDWTSNSVAVQALGIQARTESLSVVEALGEFKA